jgi:hypothetical protein
MRALMAETQSDGHVVRASRLIYMLREMRCALEGETLGLRSAGRGGQNSRSLDGRSMGATGCPRARPIRRRRRRARRTSDRRQLGVRNQFINGRSRSRPFEPVPV